MDDLVRASDGKTVQFSVDSKENDERVHTISAIHAINLVIARATRAANHSVFQIGRNKLYLDNEKESIGSGPCRIKRLYINSQSWHGSTFTQHQSSYDRILLFSVRGGLPEGSRSRWTKGPWECKGQGGLFWTHPHHPGSLVTTLPSNRSSRSLYRQKQTQLKGL